VSRDGKFSETAEQTSDPEIKFPSFFRYVVSVDSKHMILGLDDSSRQNGGGANGPWSTWIPRYHLLIINSYLSSFLRCT